MIKPRTKREGMEAMRVVSVMLRLKMSMTFPRFVSVCVHVRITTNPEKYVIPETRQCTSCDCEGDGSLFL